MVWGFIFKSAGIASLFLLIAAAVSGVFLRKLKLKITHHKIIAFFAITAAIVHGAFIIIIEYII